MQNNIDISDLKVDAFTTPCPIVAGEIDSIARIISVMEENGIRHLPVVNAKNEAVGIITDRDVATVKAFAFNQDLVAKDLMSPRPVVIREGASLEEAAFVMSEKKIGSLIVTDNSGQVSGIFTSTDALNALIEVLRGELLETE
jgi:acetoin utilization protein AcuB